MCHMCSTASATMWCSNQLIGAVGNLGNREDKSWEPHNILKIKDWNRGNRGNRKLLQIQLYFTERAGRGCTRARIVKIRFPRFPRFPKK